MRPAKKSTKSLSAGTSVAGLDTPLRHLCSTSIAVALDCKAQHVYALRHALDGFCPNLRKSVSTLGPRLKTNCVSYQPNLHKYTPSNFRCLEGQQPRAQARSRRPEAEENSNDDEKNANIQHVFSFPTLSSSRAICAPQVLRSSMSSSASTRSPFLC